MVAEGDQSEGEAGVCLNQCAARGEMRQGRCVCHSRSHDERHLSFQDGPLVCCIFPSDST